MMYDARKKRNTGGMTRREFYTRIGLSQDIDALTQAAYDFNIAKQQEKPDIGAAHEDPWHISFHGSAFPGDNPRACGRRAIYRMMDIPRPLPPRWLIQIADAGKDIEDRIVQNWHDAGYLLSSPPYDYRGRKNPQTQFEDPEVWLTSTVDSIVLFPTSGTGRVCEIKSKWADDIHAMFNLYRGPDPAHIFQVKAQIGLAHEEGPREVKRCYNSGRLSIVIGRHKGVEISVCPEHMHDECLRPETVLPPESGSLYYVSRDHPTDTWEFFFDYDPQFMIEGRKQLASWKRWFIEGLLPQTNLEDKRFSHPMGWTWTKSKKDPLSPCEWCDYGDLCREDHRKAVAQGKPIKLSESAGIEAAREVRAGYDFDLVQMAVLKRWENDNDTAGD